LEWTSRSAARSRPADVNVVHGRTLTTGAQKWGGAGAFPQDCRHGIDAAQADISQPPHHLHVRLGPRHGGLADEFGRDDRIAGVLRTRVRAFQFFGGVPEAVVPDQLRSGVSSPCRYEPGIQRTYEELAAHYNTTVLPARPAHPRDKAKVEVAVQIAERWILARLRNETHYTLDSLNERIAELLEELNARTMGVYQTSRTALFEKIERQALRPRPAAPFTYGEWKVARINIDYHVEVDGHYYSVPSR